MPGYGPDNTPLNRFDFKQMRNSVLRVLNLEKGIGYTIYNLTIQPGRTLNTYLFEDRAKLAKPIGFLLLTVTIATFLTVNVIDIKSVFAASNQGVDFNLPGQENLQYDELMNRAGEIFSQYYNLLMLIGVPILALGSYALFSEYRYNFVEHLVISTYITSIITVLYIITFPAFMYNYEISSVIYLLLFFVYLVFVYKQLFHCRFWKSFLRTFVILTIYQFAFSFILMLIGVYLGISYALQNGGG